MKTFQLSNLPLFLALVFAIGFYTSCQNNNESSTSIPVATSAVTTPTTTLVVDDKKENTGLEVSSNSESPEPLKNLKSKDLIYAWVDKLNIRDKANLKGKAITSVDSDEVLEFTGVKSGDVETIVLRGVAYEDLWYKIITKDGTEAWVYGGAVKRKEEKKGNAPITEEKFDFPYFGSFDLSGWKKLGTRTEGEEVDYEITSYQKGNQILETTSSDMGEMYYGYDYKLMDKDKKVLKERSFSFSGDGRMLEEKVKDFTTNTEYTRSQTLKKHWYQLNAKPVMVNGSWSSKKMTAKTTTKGIATTSNANSNAVKVSFKEKVQGYEVSVSWDPDHQMSGHVLGVATLAFTKNGTSFTAKNNFFGMPTNLVDADFDEDDRIKKIKTRKIDVDYKDHKIGENKIGYPQHPFIFVDLDFDGEKEILLCQPGQGNRGRTTFLVYGSNGKQKTGNPYDILDSETKVDAANKEITFLKSGGACASETEIYQAKSAGLQLVKKLKQSTEGEKCMESTYEVSNGNEKFISKKELTY